MKVFAIRDEAQDGRCVGYLFYYEKSGRFFIELSSDMDEWETLFLFSRERREGRLHIGSELASRWVQSRIIPPDRQNLGMILRDNKIKEYDPYRLLVIAEGRCAQDECYIERTDVESLSREMRERLQKKVAEILTTDEGLIVFFRDGHTRIGRLEAILSGDRRFDAILSDESRRRACRVTPGGNGIEWDDRRCIPAEALREWGKSIPISLSDMESFLQSRVMSTAQLTEEQHISRQYVSQCIKEEKLSPLRCGCNGQWFLRGSIEAEA